MNVKTWAVTAALAAATSTLPYAGASAADATKGSASSSVKRGAYLVTYGGCNDCHTPWKMGASGPAPDLARMLSGHPEDMAMPPAPKLPAGPWVATVSGSMTAWSGPWGVSFTANLTPDPETGLGKWTYENFAEAMKTGRHMGRGRPILPPMPFYSVAKLTDQDLKAVWAYLRSIPPIKNRVPDPIPPEQAPGGPPGGGPPAGGAPATGQPPAPGR